MKKKATLKYDSNNLIITQKGFDEKVSAKTESIFAQGNGYLGIRAVDEEISSHNKEDFFVTGFFNQGDENEVTELANLADLIQTSIFIDGERLRLTSDDFYEKRLDLKTGMMERRIEFHRNQKFFQCTFKRIVSQSNKHLYAQRIVLKQLSSGTSFIQMFPRIDGQTTNHGIQHFKEGHKRLHAKNAIQYFEQATQTNRFVAHNMFIRAFNNKEPLLSGNDDFVIQMERRRIGFKISTILKPHSKIELEKIMSVNTTQDEGFTTEEKNQEYAKELMEHLKTLSFSSLVEVAKEEWKDIYAKFPVKIGGDSEDAKYDMLSLYFALYHQNIFVPKHTDRVSVGAKGLSGEGYQGHCYWDTEFYVLPNFVLNEPQIARNLLIYRYKGIQGARLKAQEGNYLGAQYPWEMAAPEDGEVTPYWGQPDVVTGEQIPIASRKQEIHVSGDIAFAVDFYFSATKDLDFMENYGYEMIFDTATFWASRAEYDSNRDLYEIKDVMGPNEYKGNIDNNAFTNRIAQKNLQLAFKYRQELLATNEGILLYEKIISRIPYEINWEHLKDVENKLVQQTPNDDLIIAENDQFLSLPIFDLSTFRLLGDAGKTLFNTSEGIKRLSGQVVKQADVVLLTNLFADLYPLEVIKRNFEYYEDKTTHDSSLSPTTHAIQAIQLRKMEIAYELFKYSINIDMGNNFHSSDKGIHSGALSSVYQSIVFGYGGVQFKNNHLHLNPILPLQWDSLKYAFQYQNARICVIVKRDRFVVFTDKNQEVEVIINGSKKLINSTRKSFGIMKTLANAVVFDFEGVLINFEEITLRAWAHAFERYNLNFFWNPNNNIAEYSDDEIFDHCILSDESAISESIKRDIVLLKGIFLDDYILEKRDLLFVEPSLKKLLSDLKKRKFKVVALAESKQALKILKTLNIDNFFNKVIYKHDKVNIHQALQMEPCEIIAIDTSFEGLKQFKKLGYHTIAITNNKKMTWEKVAHATFNSKKLLDIEKIILSTHLNVHNKNIDLSNLKVIKGENNYDL